MRTLTFVVILLLFSSVVMAQRGTIRGRTIDSDKQSLPMASVALKGSTYGTISDVNGNYVLSNLPAGSYTVEVSYIGFNTLSKSVSVEGGSTVVVDFELEPGLELEEVVINSRLVGQAKALNSQRNAANITNVVSEEQLEKFPDANIGDALKRLTGINVQYDQGEARFGNIRGTAPQMSSITINGERIPSAEAEIRSIQLDLVPSDMVQTVEYNKAVTPDMDADAIGGSINLVTKSAPYQTEIKGKAGAGWNFVSMKPSFKGSVTLGHRFLDDKIGMVLSASGYDNQLGSDDLEAEWDYENEDDKNGSAYPSELQLRQYYLERLRQSYSAAFDFKLNDNHILYLKGIYNHRNDWENRFRIEYKDLKPMDEGYTGQYDYFKEEGETKFVRQTKFGVEDNKYRRLEDQRMMTFSFGGDHQIGRVAVDWMAAYSKASEERPNERYVEYEIEDKGLELDLSDLETPMIVSHEDEAESGDFTDAWEFGELTEEYQYTEEVDMNGRLNIEIPLMSGAYANSLKVGGRYRGKEKSRDNWLKEYEPTEAYENEFDQLVYANLTDEGKDNYMPGDYDLGHFVDPEISDKIDLYDETKFEAEDDLSEEAGDFDAKEDVIAGYLMLTQNLGEKIMLIAGVRAEQTNLEYKGSIFDEPEDGDPVLTATDVMKDEYLNVLPGLHLKYSPEKYTNVRAAWTNTLARPNYFDLVPYQEISGEDNEIKIGNPNLNPTTSMNIDFIVEHFFKTIGVVSGGVFYKDITDVIAYESHKDYTYAGHTYDEFFQPINAGNASLLGFELALSRRLDFMPSVLKNLTFYGNYTYAKSKLEDIQFEGREDEDLPMGGSPEHAFNLSLAYDTKPLDIRISYSHASAFLNINDDGGYGEEAFYDYYYDKVDYLDINADYKINEHWKVFVNATNLLNQPLRTYAGVSERTMQSEYYGPKINLGVKFKF